MSSRLLIAPLAIALLAGCNTIDPVSESVDPGFGEAARYNAEIQTIDPAPAYDELDAQPGSSGAKAAAAARRYRTDNVKEVEILSSTSKRRAGGGGSGPQ